jgi:hypothetical protein
MLPIGPLNQTIKKDGSMAVYSAASRPLYCPRTSRDGRKALVAEMTTRFVLAFARDRNGRVGMSWLESSFHIGTPHGWKPSG